MTGISVRRNRKNRKIPRKFPPPFDSGGKLCYNKKNADRLKAAKRKIGICRIVRTCHSEPEFPVIASQSSDWRGNPPVRRTTSRGRIPENGTKTMVCMTISCLEFDGDSHESSAHWFGMTVLFGARTSLFKFQFVAPQNDTERVVLHAVNLNLNDCRGQSYQN